MLLKMAVVRGIVDGDIRCVFRRWRAPRAKPGGRQRTPLGELRIDKVSEVAMHALTADDAAQSGHADLAELLKSLDGREGQVYRIELSFAGADPRVALREQAEPTPSECETLAEQLARKDRTTPWTWDTLRAIRDREGTRAEDLAASLGQEKAPFKRRVRQLKELGLTISLERGYALSPRGRALLAWRDSS